MRYNNLVRRADPRVALRQTRKSYSSYSQDFTRRVISVLLTCSFRTREFGPTLAFPARVEHQHLEVGRYEISHSA